MASPDLVTSVSASTPTSTSIRVSLTSTNSTAPSLGAETETITFVTTEAFWNVINSTKQDILTFQYVSTQDFNRLDQERELRRRKIRFRRYNAEERFLIVVIPGKPHERLHLRLYREIIKYIDRMGLDDAWNDDGATTSPQRPGPQRLGGNRGEGDSSGSPYPQPNGRNWPTLVIEAGDSSSLEKLWADMRW
ncbi:hypothetical protein B0H67DRAFT_653841 [Lasiosphaeris hirsuta]|uniref:Uncharacterized protein n=1 Tax=Lasiosphaeris hirsuta TaxID=260670 RepID=A0AA40BBH0_9PEZI|nr:hypothetical protein B0H67DRAFT_653841 [Lasiosphaeris hirsuta]